MTDSTASAVGSIVITTPASRTASRADAATTAPASASGPVADGDRSHTRVFRPAATRLRVIADPMMPAPITATAARASLPFVPGIVAPFLLRTTPLVGIQAIGSSMAARTAQRIAASGIRQVPVAGNVVAALHHLTPSSAAYWGSSIGAGRRADGTAPRGDHAADERRRGHTGYRAGWPPAAARPPRRPRRIPPPVVPPRHQHRHPAQRGLLLGDARAPGSRPPSQPSQRVHPLRRRGPPGARASPDGWAEQAWP